jgi:hypothetical protein
VPPFIGIQAVQPHPDAKPRIEVLRAWMIYSLVKRAIKSGDIRKDLDPLDLLRAFDRRVERRLHPNWQQSAKRLVDILITGSRPVA